jgi:hypothetical protein
MGVLIGWERKKYGVFVGEIPWEAANWKSATGLYPEPDNSIPHPHTPFLLYQFEYYPPIYIWVSQMVFLLEFCTRLMSPVL